MEGQEQTYVYHWNRCGRKGQRCKVTARGKMNSCRLEFDDGFIMITSRNAIRKLQVAWMKEGTVDEMIEFLAGKRAAK